MKGRRYEQLESCRRRQRGEYDAAISLQKAKYAEKYAALWEAGEEPLAELGVRVQQAVLQYEGTNPFVLSVQRQARQGGGGYWLPSVAQTKAVARALGLN